MIVFTQLHPASFPSVYLRCAFSFWCYNLWILWRWPFTPRRLVAGLPVPCLPFIQNPSFKAHYIVMLMCIPHACYKYILARSAFTAMECLVWPQVHLFQSGYNNIAHFHRLSVNSAPRTYILCGSLTTSSLLSPYCLQFLYLGLQSYTWTILPLDIKG